MAWSEILSGLVGAAVPLLLWWLDRKRNNSDVSRLTIEGADWVERKKFGYNWLLSALISLDRAALPELTDITGGTVTKKAKVFNKSQETWALVVYNDAMVVGYWSCFSLSENLVNKLKSGLMYDSEIVSQQIKSLRDDGPHHIYFEMIGIHPGFKWCEHHIRDKLYSSLGEFVEIISQQSSEVVGIYANGFSEEGIHICKSMSMTPIAESVQGGQIFAAFDIPKIAKRARARATRSRIVAAVRG